MSPSLLQVFAVSDTHAQELIVGLLAGVPDLEVTAESARAGQLVTTACLDEVQARWVRRLVTSIDFNARLLFTSHGPQEPVAA